MEFHISLFMFNFLLQYCAGGVNKSINVAVLLPFDESRLFSVKHIAPAISLAIEKIVENPMYTVNNLSVRYADTKCDIAFGINHAIEFYMYNQVDAFFGPVCDFAVAPVARQVMFWNLPVISGGAMARDFIMYKNTTYGMLTRVGPINFQTLSMLVVNVLTIFKWNRLKLLYDSSGQDYIVTGFCHLLTEALHYDLLSVQPVIEQDYFRVDEGVDIEQLLSREVGLQYSAWRHTESRMRYYLPKWWFCGI
ncbi:hypothetical protein LOTGIDRAFT_173214 [Lottia gigantea]|uniref:Receptor ligand binding region domain-containing protein n=1 Tax=Lottia gigantea TaxID=225164 RepID=V4A8Y8_LOTGI|nr:hypothetical protein LOTGIDRAFT_173214 [Lottia gigantea]ESP00404.1 hypothetical protein LOTGIDRAFT_173214 [Lottia gigantea]